MYSDFLSLKLLGPGRNAWLAMTFIVVLSVLAPEYAFGQVAAKKTFPRLGGYQIGATPFAGVEDPEYQEQLARLDYVILGISVSKVNEAAAAIRKRNSGIMLAKYTNIIDVSDSRPNFQEERRNKVFSGKGPNSSNAIDWWARDYQGNITSNWPGYWMVNITDYTRPDSNGDRFPEWAAKHYFDNFMQYPVWDAWFQDVVFYKPRTTESGASVDWSGGKETSTGKINAQYRNGHRRYWSRIRELSPKQHIFVNHDWYNAQGGKVTEYVKQVNGGLLERIMKSDTVDANGSRWQKVMANYRVTFEYMIAPKIVMFVVQGDPKDYRFMRYSFATCLLNDGYYDFAPWTNHYGTVEWFDEFDLAGTSTTAWLGRARDNPPTTSWKSGVWRRDFDGGVALVNPAGNGRKTVTIENGFRRIKGQQDPKINNGKVVTSVTLDEGDGILLIRDNATPVQAPPKKPTATIS